jgi:hypothetical protein
MSKVLYKFNWLFLCLEIPDQVLFRANWCALFRHEYHEFTISLTVRLAFLQKSHEILVVQILNCIFLALAFFIYLALSSFRFFNEFLGEERFWIFDLTNISGLLFINSYTRNVVAHSFVSFIDYNSAVTHRFIIYSRKYSSEFYFLLYSSHLHDFRLDLVFFLVTDGLWYRIYFVYIC